MKTIPAGLASHLLERCTTLAYALKVTRQPGTDYEEIFGFTSHDRDAVIPDDDESPTVDITYESGPGLDVSQIVTAANMAVGNLELSTLDDGEVFTKLDVLNGRWRGAVFKIFRYNYEDLTDGVETLLVGTIGEVEIRNQMVVAELRDLRQYLQHPVGSPSTKNCRYRLGDSKCAIDLEALRVTGTITGVTSDQVFRDSARTEDADHFGEGFLTWTSGNNEGASQKVKTYAANGTFTLSLTMYGAVQVGDTYSVVPGCRKRLEEDCRDKFDNVVNFGGEPHRPFLDDLTQSVTVDV